MVPRAMYYGFRELQFVDDFARISEQFYLQALFGSAAFVLSFILMLVVFTGSFLIFRHREQQSLRETIGNLEKGRYNPSLKLAMDIARVFETTVEELFWFTEE